MSDYVGENADRLVTIELRTSALPRNYLQRLYYAARERTGGRPISALAAEVLHETVGAGDVVFLITGAGYPPSMPKGENDGPPGAAALACALFRGLGAVPVFVCETAHCDPIIASAQALGLMVHPLHIARSHALGAAIEPAPLSQAQVNAWAGALLDRCQPKAVVAIEKVGPGEGELFTQQPAWQSTTAPPVSRGWSRSRPSSNRLALAESSRSASGTAATRSASATCQRLLRSSFRTAVGSIAGLGRTFCCPRPPPIGVHMLSRRAWPRGFDEQTSCTRLALRGGCCAVAWKQEAWKH